MNRKIFLMLGVVAMSSLLKAQEGKVGINTESPKETLQVVGSLQVTKLPQKDEANSVYINPTDTERKGTFTPVKMVVADANGVLGQQDIPVNPFDTAQEDVKPFYYIEYNLQNVNGDYVSSFDTKVPSDKYTLVVVGAELVPYNSNSAYYILVGATGTIGNRMFSPHNVSASVSGDKKWIISADYPSASLVNPSGTAIRGTWKIKCLVINNNVVNVLPAASQNLGGSDTAVSTVTPNEIL